MRDDPLVTGSPESCSNGISEPKRRKLLAMSFADEVISYTNLKVGRNKVLRKNVQRMPFSSNSVGNKD